MQEHGAIFYMVDITVYIYQQVIGKLFEIKSQIKLQRFTIKGRMSNVPAASLMFIK